MVGGERTALSPARKLEVKKNAAQQMKKWGSENLVILYTQQNISSGGDKMKWLKLFSH